MVRAVTPIPFVKARFFDRCGKPLTGGQIYTYEANTTTPKATYKDPYGLTPNTNPIILDAAGEADIYLDGTYRIRITDRNDVLVNDVAKIGSWFSDNLQDTLDNISRAMNDAIKPALQNLDEAINTAAAAGAGANGWTDTLIAVSENVNQRQINDGLESIAQLLSIKNPRNGQRVYVKSYHAGLNKGGGEFIYDSSKTNINNGVTVFNGWVRNDVKFFTPEMAGAKGKLNDDKSVFANLSPDYIFALGKEYSMDVWRSPARIVQGNNTTVHLNSASGTDTTAALQIPDGAHYSDINFVNNPNSNLAWSYGTCGNDVVLTNIGFYNFIDTNSYNAWGLYLSNKKNITLNSPKFGNNSLADIAIVDNVSNVTINNAFDTVNPDGIILDIEPNGIGNIENINVVGGKYAQINVLENSYQSNGIKGVNITGATVKLLELRGGQVKVSGGRVETIKGSTSEHKDYADLQNAFFGQLEIDNVNVSKNLITDDKVLSFSGYEPSSFWSLYAPDVGDTKTIYDSHGFYTALNATKQSSYQELTTRNFIDLPSGTTQVATMISYSVENATDSLMFEPVVLSFFDSNGTLIGREVSIKGGRTLPGTKYPWVNEVSICDVPNNATKFKIGVRSNKKGSALNIRKIGVHALSMSDVKGNFNAIMQSYAQPNLTKSLKAQQTLSYSIDANAIKYTEKVVIGAKVGDMVQISTTNPVGATSRIWAEISSDNTLSIYHQNLTAAAVAINTTANFIIQ